MLFWLKSVKNSVENLSDGGLLNPDKGVVLFQQGEAQQLVQSLSQFGVHPLALVSEERHLAVDVLQNGHWRRRVGRTSRQTETRIYRPLTPS